MKTVVKTQCPGSSGLGSHFEMDHLGDDVADADPRDAPILQLQKQQQLNGNTPPPVHGMATVANAEFDEVVARIMCVFRPQHSLPRKPHPLTLCIDAA